jgi:hypothetical protein
MYFWNLPHLFQTKKRLKAVHEATSKQKSTTDVGLVKWRPRPYCVQSCNVQCAMTNFFRSSEILVKIYIMSTFFGIAKFGAYPKIFKLNLLDF